MESIFAGEGTASNTLLDFSTDKVIGEYARFGVIVRSSALTVENELRHYFSDDKFALYHSRFGAQANVDIENDTEIAPSVEQAASLLPANQYSCIGLTSVSMGSILGSEKIVSLIAKYHETPVTDALRASIVALKAVGAKAILHIGTHRTDSMQRLRNSLASEGLPVVHETSFNESSEDIIARICEASIVENIANITQQYPCDSVFVSCTNLRTVHIIDQLESRLHIPVICANQALAWHMSKLSGLETSTWEYGLLGRF